MADRLTSRGIIRRTERWYQPDADDIDGPLPPPATTTTATVAQQAPLWIEQPGQERGNGPQWFAPDDDYEPPPVTRLWPILGGNFPMQGGLWPGGNPSAFWDGTATTPRTRFLEDDRSSAGTWATGAGQFASGTGTSGDDVLQVAVLSRPIAGDTLITGYVRGMFVEQEALVGDDYRAQVVVTVVANNGQTVRGVLYAGDAAGLVSEFNTGNQARKFPPTWDGGAGALVAPVQALDGDRILVEIGFRSFSTSTSNGVLTGSNLSTADLPTADETTSSGQPWIEFSSRIRFQAEPLPRELGGVWYDAQPFVENAQRWYQPDADDIDGPLPPPATTTFDPATGFPWQDQPQDPATGARWFQPADGTEAILPNLTVATVDQAAALWQEQPGQERSLAQAWFQPADGTEAVFTTLPFVAGPTVDLQAGLWQDQSGQQDRAIGPVWFQPDTEILTALPGLPSAPTAAQLAELWQDSSPQQDRAIQPVWFQPDPDVLGMPTGTQTTATVPQQAGLWQDQSGQQDRAIQPVWHAPDAVQDVPNTVVPPTVATVAQQAPLWIEQPYPYAGTGHRWYDAGVEPVNGPLQPWLFTVGSPGGGAVPQVLINASTGEVVLYIGSNIVIPAS